MPVWNLPQSQLFRENPNGKGGLRRILLNGGGNGDGSFAPCDPLLYCAAYMWLGAYRSGTGAVSHEGVSRNGLAFWIREAIWRKQANVKLPLRAVPRAVVSGVADTLSTSRPFRGGVEG
jgi:hypothetical protein